MWNWLVFSPRIFSRRIKGTDCRTGYLFAEKVRLKAAKPATPRKYRGDLQTFVNIPAGSNDKDGLSEAISLNSRAQEQGRAALTVAT